MSASAIADWRIETLKCIDQLSCGQEPPVKSAADKILRYLEPIISPAITPEQDAALRNDVVQLCEDAYNVRMMMRWSKEDYSVWTPVLSETSNDAWLPNVSDFADGFDVEGGKGNSGSDKIAYTLFGALTKHPEYRGEGLCILEKAHVVLEKK